MTLREAMLASGGINQHYNGPAEMGRPVDTFINVDCASAERTYLHNLPKIAMYQRKPWIPKWLWRRITFIEWRRVNEIL